MFELYDKSTHMFKNILNAIKDLLEQARFVCTDKGIMMQHMDSSHVCLVHLLLYPDAFKKYRCDNPIELGINIKSLVTIFKAAKPNHSLVMRAEEKSDVVHIEFDNKRRDLNKKYKLKLLELDVETLGIPDANYQSKLWISVKELLTIMRDVSYFNENVTITTTGASLDRTRPAPACEMKIIFSAEGDAGEVKITKGNYDENADESGSDDADDEPKEQKKRKRKIILVKNGNKKAKVVDDEGDDIEPAKKVRVAKNTISHYSIKYILKFISSCNLDEHITMLISDEWPLKLRFIIGEGKGSLSLYIAPRIEGE